MYKTFKAKGGSIRYMLDGRLVKKSSIPADVLIKLNVGMEVDEKPVEKKELTCIFCDAPTRITRFLNMQSIAVCEEHYYSKNVGQTVQRLNQINGAKQDEKANVEEQHQEDRQLQGQKQ